LIRKFGGSYVRELGIDSPCRDSTETYKWFLAAILFGAKIAAKTYAGFALIEAVSSETILTAGWNELVQILGRGGYTRYDFKTAD
jgi:hypothetical protein